MRFEAASVKVSKHDANTEKRILTGMIVNDGFCGQIAARWQEGGLFRVRWANLVGEWCVAYYRQYTAAPRVNIEGLFTAWASTTTDNNTVDLVEDFLDDLSGEYEETAAEINTAYLADQAADHFTHVRLAEMADLIQGHLDAGQINKAESVASGWGRVEMGTHGACNLMQDQDALYAAFDDEATEPLVRYPGALGRFFGPQLGRDEFICLTGQTGIGKSWWLMDIAWRAMRQGRRVAFFEVGDMSKSQAVRRFGCRAAGIPTKPPLEVRIPEGIDIEDGLAEVEFRDRTFQRCCKPPDAWRAFQRNLRRRNRVLFKLSVHGNSSINVAGIRAELDLWEQQEGWVPDVVVIDYADILAPPAGFQEGERDGINANWKALRRLSQDLHALVVTAAQADAASYDAKTIARSNFSDDRRKNDHVTGMIGINATPEEMDSQVRRLNWTKRREFAYQSASCVHVAGCLALARPAILSAFP